MTDAAAPPRGLPTALVAFLRGVERRAAVLAELQTGDAGRGDAAVAAAVRAFMADAGAAPLAEWPPRFWAALLAQPALRRHTPVALALDAGDALGLLGSGVRAAVLVRLATGLDEAPAAAALGVPVSAYRRALQAALPQDAAGRPDPRAWERLQAHVQRRIDAFPPERLSRIREAAFRSAPAPAARGAPPVAAPRGPRWLRALLWALLLLCALALAATFWPPWRDAFLDGLEGGEARVRVEPLPPAAAPRRRLADDARLLAHPDFELLRQGPQAPEELAFASWLAAQGEADRPPPRPLVPQEPPVHHAGDALPPAVPETDGSHAAP